MDKQEKDERDEEPDQDRVLRSIVRNALENKGVLSQIRAMLRAAVFTCVDEHEQTLGIYSPNSTAGEVKNDPEGLFCLHVVIDFLLHFRLNQTLSILKVEANLGEEDSPSVEELKRMAAIRGIDRDNWDDGRPLLMQLLLDRKTHAAVRAASQREGHDDGRTNWRGSGDASAASDDRRDERGHRQGGSRGDDNTAVSAKRFGALFGDDSDEDAAPQREGRDDKRNSWRGSGDASAASDDRRDEPGHRQGGSRGDDNTAVSAKRFGSLFGEDSDEDAVDGGYAGPEAEIDPEVEALIDAQIRGGDNQDLADTDATAQNVDTDDEGRDNDTHPRDRDRQDRVDPHRHDGLVDRLDPDGCDDARVVEGDGTADAEGDVDGDREERERGEDGGRKSVLHPGITLRRRTSGRASSASASGRHPPDSEALERAASEMEVESDGAVRSDPVGAERALPGSRHAAVPSSGEQPYESRAEGNDRPFRHETFAVARRDEPDGNEDPVDILEQNRGSNEKERGPQQERRTLEEVNFEGNEADFVHEEMLEEELYEDTKLATVDESERRGTPPEGKASSTLAASIASSTASADSENRGRKRWGVRQVHVGEIPAEYRDRGQYGEDETSKTAARFRQIVIDEDDIVENSTEMEAPPRDLLEDFDDEEVAEPAKPPPLPVTPSDRPLVAWPRRPDSQTRRAEVLVSAGDLTSDYDDELGGSHHSTSVVSGGEGRVRPFQGGSMKMSGHMGANDGRGLARRSERVQTQKSQGEARGRKEGRESTVTKAAAAAGNGGQSYSFEGDAYGDDEFEEFDGSDIFREDLDVTVFRPSEDEDSHLDIDRNGDRYETDERQVAVQEGRDRRHAEEDSYAEDGELFDEEALEEESELERARSGAEGDRSDLEWELRMGMGSSDDNSSGIRDGSNRVLEDLGYEIESAEDPPSVRASRPASST